MRLNWLTPESELRVMEEQAHAVLGALADQRDPLNAPLLRATLRLLQAIAELRDARRAAGVVDDTSETVH